MKDIFHQFAALSCVKRELNYQRWFNVSQSLCTSSLQLVIEELANYNIGLDEVEATLRWINEVPTIEVGLRDVF